MSVPGEEVRLNGAMVVFVVAYAIVAKMSRVEARL